MDIYGINNILPADSTEVTCPTELSASSLLCEPRIWTEILEKSLGLVGQIHEFLCYSDIL